jgi:hypothetical protein
MNNVTQLGGTSASEGRWTPPSRTNPRLPVEARFRPMLMQQGENADQDIVARQAAQQQQQ